MPTGPDIVHNLMVERGDEGRFVCTPRCRRCRERVLRARMVLISARLGARLYMQRPTRRRMARRTSAVASGCTAAASRGPPLCRTTRWPSRFERRSSASGTSCARYRGPSLLSPFGLHSCVCEHTCVTPYTTDAPGRGVGRYVHVKDSRRIRSGRDLIGRRGVRALSLFPCAPARCLVLLVAIAHWPSAIREDLWSGICAPSSRP